MEVEGSLLLDRQCSRPQMDLWGDTSSNSTSPEAVAGTRNGLDRPQSLGNGTALLPNSAPLTGAWAETGLGCKYTPSKAIPATSQQDGY